jgi:Zn-dependent peptidase ImmA (M78 family)
MIHKNNYLLSLFAVSLFSYSSSSAMLTSMLKPITKNIAKEQENKKYKQKILEVKRLTTVSDVDHEIDKLKNDVYHELLKEIEDITQQPHDTFKFDAQRDIVKDLLRIENPFITQEHSKNIPLSIYNDLISLLKNNNIDPKHVTLQYTINSDQNMFAHSIGARFNSQDFPYFHKPQIQLFSAITKRPQSQQLFTYQHELSHILLHHSYISEVAYSHTDDPINCNIDKLVSIIEREADIHAASKNLLLAGTSLDLRCNGISHRKIIDPKKHCDDMITIYTLMLHKEKLAQKKASKV